MKCRIFLDTNVFIYGFEYKDSNSAKVLTLLNNGEVEGVISEQVVKEVVRYFQKYHTKELANLFRRYLFHSCLIVRNEQLKDVMREYSGKIKDKDLEQLAATKKLGIKFLVSYDEDFEPFEEYIKPKAFIAKMNQKPAETEY